MYPRRKATSSPVFNSTAMLDAIRGREMRDSVGVSRHLLISKRKLTHYRKPPRVDTMLPGDYRSNGILREVLWMKILVIGGGGREHALVWKLKRSARVEKIWCAPGNGGISNDAECVPLDLRNVAEAADLAAELDADLTICGPELP